MLDVFFGNDALLFLLKQRDTVSQGCERIILLAESFFRPGGDSLEDGFIEDDLSPADAIPTVGHGLEVGYSKCPGLEASAGLEFTVPLPEEYIRFLDNILDILPRAIDRDDVRPDVRLDIRNPLLDLLGGGAWVWFDGVSDAIPWSY